MAVFKKVRSQEPERKPRDGIEAVDLPVVFPLRQFLPEK
jgi:hypothetical protein